MNFLTSSSSLRRGMVALVVGATSTVSACAVPGLSALGQHPSNVLSSEAATGPQTPADTPAPPELTTGVVQGNNGWSTYTNAKLGITFRFPTKMRVSNGKPCVKQSYGAWYSYLMVPGVVPTVVIKDGDTFYIAQKYGYQPGNITGSVPTQIYHSCKKVTTTRAALRQYRATLNHHTGPYHFFAITVAQVETQTDVKRYLKQTFSGCPSFKLKGMGVSTAGPWRNVNFSCPRDSSYFVGFGTPAYITNYSKTRYYPDQQLLVILWFAQADHIYGAKEKLNDIGLSQAEAKVRESFTVVP